MGESAGRQRTADSAPVRDLTTDPSRRTPPTLTAQVVYALSGSHHALAMRAARLNPARRRRSSTRLIKHKMRKWQVKRADAAPGHNPDLDHQPSLSGPPTERLVPSPPPPRHNAGDQPGPREGDVATLRAGEVCGTAPHRSSPRCASGPWRALRVDRWLVGAATPGGRSPRARRDHTPRRRT